MCGQSNVCAIYQRVKKELIFKLELTHFRIFPLTEKSFEFHLSS